ncbi:TIGR01621 family pseudouridine synthase [Alkalimarinus alittae]|uniref:TIGR01621 family pseudouridine synthase n=1 Tax=Alkalimarinus alittae TaxID=2961619 RepID=A0ABY6MY93_9ALTE|nr:TIGR01621 family pseudouridine synthase [Alkalimarinus alittae]UZE94770.1 TIGR01621 family pseudouridine synthase [Alkalimarinus alittae]
MNIETTDSTDTFSDDAFQLVAQNEQFIIINKMPGISFHTENEVLGIVERVKSAMGVSELYPVHRLDKITSGLLVLARTPEANRAISTLFRERRVDKYYLAVSDRKPSKKQGMIKGDMVRSRRSMWKLSKTLENPAITQFFSTSLVSGKRLFLVKPKTGKTHQIRVALNSVGAPVLGDPLYNTDSMKVASRGYLHAYAIRFNLAGTDYCFVSEPTVGALFTSPAFKQAIKQYAEPWLLAWPKTNV